MLSNKESQEKIDNDSSNNTTGYSEEDKTDHFRTDNLIQKPCHPPIAKAAGLIIFKK
jgi:hypothetical protein